MKRENNKKFKKIKKIQKKYFKLTYCATSNKLCENL